MNRHARSKRRKGCTKTMTNEETTDKTAAAAVRSAPVAPKKTPAPKGKKATPQKKAKAQKKAGKPTRKETGAPGAESKGAKILEMIRGPQGATLVEIMKAAEWQAHSVRGFISTAGKKHNVKIES